MKEILLKNVRLPDRKDNTDILIKDGKIAAIGGPAPADAEVCDMRGMLCMPGFVDMHCHLREPGFEYKETIYSGTRAAAVGGFTAVACMPNTKPPVDNAGTLSFIKSKAETEGAVRVYPIAAVSKGLAGKEITEMGELAEYGAVAFSDDGKPVGDGNLMKLAMQYAWQFGRRIINHCEDERMVNGGVMNEGYTSTMLGLAGWDRAAEEAMIARDIALSESLDIPVHIAHVTTKGGAAIIRSAKARGVKVTAETMPHYIAGTDELVIGYDTNAKVNPPLREQKDVDALIDALCDGTIDAIATDHAPHDTDSKRVEFNTAASGISAFETAFSLCYTVLVKSGRMTEEELSRKMTAAPAGILSIDCGYLGEGSPADLTFADTENEYEIDPSEFVSMGKNTPFGGRRVYGKIMYTMVGGKFVVKEGRLV